MTAAQRGERAAVAKQAGRTAPKPPKTTTDTGSPLEKALDASLRASGVVGYEREFRFHPTRKWRVDFMFTDQRLAVEVEGAIYRGGGHTTATGLKRDIDKSNALMLMGYRLLRVHGDQVRSGEATALIQQAIAPSAPGEGQK